MGTPDGYLTVARTLNKSGRKTKRHRAESGRVKTGGNWTKDAVLRVLKNPVYAGFIPYDGELHPGEHDRIVEPERFQRMQYLLEGHGSRSRARGRNPEYILRGRLRCLACGKSLTPASTRKGGREYRYYRCVTQDKKGRKSCPARPLPAEAIESVVVNKIREAVAGGTLVTEITRNLEARIEKRRKDMKVERRDIPVAIAKLSSEGKKIAEKIASTDGKARRLLEERLQEIDQEIGPHESRLVEVERTLAEIDCVELDAKWVTDSLARFDEVWDVLTHDNRGRLVRAVIQRVEVDEPEGKISVLLADVGLDALAEIDARADGTPAPARSAAPPATEEARP